MRTSFCSVLFSSFHKTTIIVMASLPTLPVHLVYCILDNLQPLDILMSVCNVCTRLNSIIDSYRPYQVKKKSLSQCTTSSSSMYPSHQYDIVIVLFLFVFTLKIVNLDRSMISKQRRLRATKWEIFMRFVFWATYYIDIWSKEGSCWQIRLSEYFSIIVNR